MRAVALARRARGGGPRGGGPGGDRADRPGDDAGEAVRASRSRRSRRHDGDLAERRHDDAHGHRGRGRVRLGLRPSGRDLLGDVRRAGYVRLPLHDPSLHAGSRARVPRRAAAAPRSRFRRGGAPGSKVSRPRATTEVVLERVSPRPRELVARATPGRTACSDSRSGRPSRGATASGRERVEPDRSGPRWRRTYRSPVEETGVVVSARPARAGSRVAIQMYERERFAFVTVARGRLDASSRAAIRYVPERRAHVRAVVRGSQGWSDGFSRPVVVLPR